MINIDVDPDPHSDPTHSPLHTNQLQSSPNNFPSTQDNDRQYQDSLYNNPSHSPLKHPFQKNSSPQDAKGEGPDPDVGKGQDEGRIVPKRLKTLAEQEAMVNHRHKFQMRTNHRQYKTLANESEGDNDESSETEEEDEKKRLNFFQKWRHKKGCKNKKKKKRNGEELAPIAKRILIDDVARQKDYYGKDYQAERVEGRNKFALTIARIAIRGKDPKASHAFRVALEKVNPEALKTARKAMEKHKRAKLKTLMKKVKEPLHPDSLFVLCMETLLFFTILAETLFCTYLVTFIPKGQLNKSNGLLIFCFVADLIFFLRVLINFHCAFYDEGGLRTSFRFIAIHYIKGMLFIDLFSLLNIIGYFFLDSAWRALIALAAIRIYKIPIIIGVFENYFQVSREIGSLIRVIKLGLILYVYAHMCACLLDAVGTHESTPTWITNGGFENESPGDMYVISIYWSSQTITTVGYGDITPVQIRERALLIFMFLCSSIILGYIIGTIASILSEMSSFTTENWEKIRLLKKYMDDKGLKKETQDRIMRYVRYYLGRENISKIKDSDMIQFLSENLKEDIIKEVNVKMLSDCYMFSRNFGRQFLLAVSKELTEKSFGPDEYVFRWKDNGSHSAYFILTGKVELVYGNCNIRVALLEKCNIFGFLAFFAEAPRALSAKSVEFTTLFELPRETFLQKLQEFPSENEAFCLIKDNIGLYKSNQNLANVRCYLCGKSSHLAIYCPIVHWYKSPLKVISKYLLKQEEFRRSFKRRDRERFSAFGRVKESREAAEKIQNSEKYDIVQNIKGPLLLGQEDAEAYSSTDEILDRNIYDPEPLVFAGDLVQSKELEVGSKYINIFDEKEEEKYENEAFIARPKVEPGEIQTFVTRQYDAYLHNLNLDQAKSWEIYFPHNNIQRILDDLEAERLKSVAKAHHLSEGILKKFKFGYDKSKSDPRTMRLTTLNTQKSLARKSTNLKNTCSDVGQSQIYVIPAKRRAVSGAKPKQDESEGLNEQIARIKTHDDVDVNMAPLHSDDDDLKENIRPLSEGNLYKSLNEEIRTEKGDEKILKEERKEGNEDAPSLVLGGEEEIEERLEDSGEYCKKVLGSDYDGLMRKFTDMLMESMKKVNEDDSVRSQEK